MSTDIAIQLEEVIAERDYWRSEAKLDAEISRRERVRRHYNITPQQAWLLVALYDAGDRVVRKDRIIEDMPGKHWEQRETCSNIVQVYVCKARKRIGKDAIEAVFGAGYRLSDAFRAELGMLLT